MPEPLLVSLPLLAPPLLEECECARPEPEVNLDAKSAKLRPDPVPFILLARVLNPPLPAPDDLKPSLRLIMNLPLPLDPSTGPDDLLIGDDDIPPSSPFFLFVLEC